jgi:DUF4097 and DUF4098 domain-containing protein YvlB
MNKFSIRLPLIVAYVCLSSLVIFAQDFQKSYRLAQGNRVSVKNVSGDVIVKGYDGDAVTVTGYKEGRDRDKLEVEDLSDGNHVDINVHYPKNCNCDASIRFEVKVPRNLNLNYDAISSVSGDVEIDGARGTLHVKAVSGDVKIINAQGTIHADSVSGDVHVERASGSVSAKSISGDVKVNLQNVDSDEAMEFTTVSGDVNVSMPSNLGAEVDLKTLSGDLKTDFGITIEKREHGPGKSAHGRLGEGSRRVKMSSVSGDVNLLKN